jgi:hypothetical protein
MRPTPSPRWPCELLPAGTAELPTTGTEADGVSAPANSLIDVPLGITVGRASGAPLSSSPPRPTPVPGRR